MPTPDVVDTRDVHEGYVAVAGAHLYFREIGSGPPLIILHGGPDFDHNYLLPEMDHLSTAFRLIYYDQRGRGQSSSGVVAEDVGIESEVDDLDRLRESFGYAAVALLGHSWGAVLAMEYATRHPERVSHLILVNPAPACHADLLRLREQRQATEANTLARMQAIAETRAYAEGSIDSEADYYRAHFGATLRPEDLERVVLRLRVHFTPQDILKARAIEDRLYDQTWRLPEYDLLPRLRRLKTPTLVIHGDRDLIPASCARNIADAVPGARFVALKCGHFSYLERPAEVLSAIVDSFSHAGSPA